MPPQCHRIDMEIRWKSFCECLCEIANSTWCMMGKRWVDVQRFLRNRQNYLTFQWLPKLQQQAILSLRFPLSLDDFNQMISEWFPFSLARMALFLRHMRFHDECDGDRGRLNANEPLLRAGYEAPVMIPSSWCWYQNQFKIQIKDIREFPPR